MGETLGPKPLPGKALRGASTVWGGFLMCVLIAEYVESKAIAKYSSRTDSHQFSVLHDLVMDKRMLFYEREELLFSTNLTWCCYLG